MNLITYANTKEESLKLARLYKATSFPKLALSQQVDYCIIGRNVWEPNLWVDPARYYSNY